MIHRGATALDDTQLAKLGEHIAMPDWEKRLIPLFQFRGAFQPHRIRALWNASYGMFLVEAPDPNYGARSLALNCAEHLCGFHRTPQSLTGFFSRLHACQPLTDSISKAFTEYIHWACPHPFLLQHVPIQTNRFIDGVTPWWRTGTKKKWLWKPPEAASADHQYPYITRSVQPEHELLLKVHAFIPASVPPSIRGDLCQDLIVAVLSGDIKVENIPDTIAKYTREAKKSMPDIWRRNTVSLDEPLPEGNGLTLMDTLLSSERYVADFTPELIEAISQAEEDHAVPAVHWRKNGIDPTRELPARKTRWSKGDVVRIKADALRRLPLVAQSRVGFRDGVVGDPVDGGGMMVAFPPTERKKGTSMPVHWDWLEAVPHVHTDTCGH